MSRELDEDFQALLAFLNAYSYSALLSQPAYVDWIRVLHRHHLALMTLIAELTADDSGLTNDFVVSYGKDGRRYLSEVGSDCSEFVLAVASGMFRSASATLRASIESFCKSMSLLQHPEILTQTSVPQVFEIAATSGFFEHRIAAQGLGELKAVYASLNHYVHAVGLPNIFGAHSAGTFPYMSKTSTELSDLFVKTVRAFLSAFIGSRMDFFGRFDHRNKALVVVSLTRPQRRLVFGQMSGD